MESDLRVLVLEHGSAITHDLSVACRGRGIAVLGPVHDLVDAKNAIEDVPVAVLVVEAAHGSVRSIREAREAFPGLGLLAAADAPSPDAGVRAIAAGAAGLVELGNDRGDLASALRRAAAGELVMPASQLSALVAMIGSPRSPAADDRTGLLTRRELEVLGLLAEGLTTTELAAALSISVLTVQSHVKSVLAKLGAHSKVEAIRYAWRTGALQMPVGA